MRGTKPLLEDADLTLNPGDKIGLIGANGAGKSTLFAMLRNELHPDQGAIDFPARWRMAYVANRVAILRISGVLHADLDGAAVGIEMEVMGGLLLIEAHDGGTAVVGAVWMLEREQTQ